MIGFDSIVPYGEAVGDLLRITKSFFVEYERQNAAGCMILSALTSYVGENAPKIQYSLTASGAEKPFFKSHFYRIGKQSEYTRQAWRVPPLFLPGMKLTVHIEIPEGTVLLMRDFSTSQDIPSADWKGGPRHNAHLGFMGLAPDNTMPAFELAAACGFPACIVVPKVTSDGVLVCIHDDTINKTARDADGNPPTGRLPHSRNSSSS